MNDTAPFPQRTHELDTGDDALAFLNREWLLTNGTGAYAMGTAAGINTRRYHGLLVASQRPPVGRVVVLNQVLEEVRIKEQAKPLSFTAAMFRDDAGRDVIEPKGHVHLRRFSRGLTVAWHYEANEVQFTRELLLHYREQAITLRYTVHGLKGEAELRLSPMLTLRDFHAVLHRNAADMFDVTAGKKDCLVQHGMVSAAFACDAGPFEQRATWWYRQHYAIEMERGQEDTEDLFVPGTFVVKLNGRAEQVVTLTASQGDKPVRPQVDAQLRAAHLLPLMARIEPLVTADVRKCSRASSEVLPAALTIAADDFVVERTIAGQRLSTILAGYPWFADWGRDTFIALPGLLLVTGRHEEARATLRTFAQAIRNGLVPNRFDDYNDTSTHYNTVDGSLWVVQAAMQYMDATGDVEAWEQWLRDACVTIIDAYIKGTDYDIRMAGDGLITAGSQETQLTWMDAACGGRVFTPRAGKAVEVNALWYNALVGMAERLEESDSQRAGHYQKLAKRVVRAFAKVFWDEEAKHLRDHVWTDDAGVEHADRSLRPNQIFAAALPRSPLPLTKQKQVVAAVRKHLLTPFGLRTLAAEHPAYHGQYRGPQMQRDEAYHQGTVWPWLIGPYAEAVLRTGRFSAEARREALAAIAPLLQSMLGEGSQPTLGQLYEIHEADRPHRPVGCMAQAWSVAEVLRVLKLMET